MLIELNMADEEANNVSSYTPIEGTEISYSRKDELGSGTFGTVYLGIFKEKKVAIKKIQLKHQQSVKEDREVKNQLEAQGHENVVSIFETVEDIDFRFIFSNIFTPFHNFFLTCFLIFLDLIYYTLLIYYMFYSDTLPWNCVPEPLGR